jgi:Raf kinase inhibitor-like YbhB/YbcL family protein
MKRHLLGAALSVAIALAAACSSSGDGGGGTSSGGPSGDGGPAADGSSGGADGATTDALASHDSATDAPPTDANVDQDAPGTFELTSTAFAANAAIPALYTCNGTNISPPLAWANAPAGTQSYAVVMRDVSLVGMPNYHWVIYDIPASAISLPQNVEQVASPSVPAGSKQTHSSFVMQYGYLGPCPPSGTHDYQLTVYSFATATIPVGAPGTDPVAADAVIQANKTGSASLTGKYMQ